MKSVLFVVGLAFLTASAPGQGTLIFKNDASAPVKWLTPYGPFPLDLGHVRLAYAPPGTQYVLPGMGSGYSMDVWLQLNPQWRLGPTAFVEKGLFSGGEASLDGFRPGESIQYLVFGWAYANTWDEAVYKDDAYWGPTIVRALPRIVLGGGDVAAPVLAQTFEGLELRPSSFVPEPGTLTLAGLGLLAWACRRQCCAK